jgi:hypothetical protein
MLKTSDLVAINPSMTPRFEFQLLPRREWLYNVDTLQCIKVRTVHQGRRHVKILGPYSAPRTISKGRSGSPDVVCLMKLVRSNLFIYLFIYSLFNDTVSNSKPGTEPATV